MSSVNRYPSKMTKVYDKAEAELALDEIIAELNRMPDSPSLPAVIQQNLPPSPKLDNLPALRVQTDRARSLIQAQGKSNPCDGCVCFRVVHEVTEDPNDLVDYGMGYIAPRVLKTTRMCAHPSYSEPIVDLTRGKLDFKPAYTCEQSREEGTICGPEGRLWVSSIPTSWEKFRENPGDLIAQVIFLTLLALPLLLAVYFSIAG